VSSTNMALTAAIKETGVELGFAESALRRALAVDPPVAEARIRLAHVLRAREHRGRRRARARGAREAAAALSRVLRRDGPGPESGTPRRRRGGQARVR